MSLELGEKKSCIREVPTISRFHLGCKIDFISFFLSNYMCLHTMKEYKHSAFNISYNFVSHLRQGPIVNKNKCYFSQISIPHKLFTNVH